MHVDLPALAGRWDLHVAYLADEGDRRGLPADLDAVLDCGEASALATHANNGGWFLKADLRQARRRTLVIDAVVVEGGQLLYLLALHSAGTARMRAHSVHSPVGATSFGVYVMWSMRRSKGSLS